MSLLLNMQGGKAVHFGPLFDIFLQSFSACDTPQSVYIDQSQEAGG